MLKDIAPIINKLSEGKNLTAEESEKAFDACLKEDKDGCFFTALNMGILAKGMTSDELLGFYKSKKKFLPKIEVNIDHHNITDNSGSGGDKLKTFNVSTTASFIISAAGITTAKQSFFAVTGVGGSGDLFAAFGIDVKKTSNPITIRESIEKIGFAPYIVGFLPDPKTVPGYHALVRRLTEDGLAYITLYHVAVNLMSPFNMERRIYGVFNKKYSKILAELLQKLNYKKVLIVHGADGLDEISNIGDTEIVELNEGKISTYVVSPEDFGIAKANYDEIKAISKEQNVIDFLRILFNKEKGPKKDIVLMNAAATFYVMDKVKTFKEGVKLANKMIVEGKAAEKLEELVKLLGDSDKLNEWKIKAKL